MQLRPNISKLAQCAVRNGEIVNAFEHSWLDKGLRVADLDIDVP